MARWQPQRADVIAEYAREVLGVHPSGRLLIGVDGIEQVEAGAEPSSREAFAADLVVAIAAEGVRAAALPLGRFAADPARPPDALYDEARFRAEVLAPYRRGEPVDVAGGPFTPGDRSALVVSGAFLHHGDLAGIWHTSAWISLPRAVARERDALRLGLPADGPEAAGWATAVDASFRLLDARKRTKATFDLTDPDHPGRRYEDAC